MNRAGLLAVMLLGACGRFGDATALPDAGRAGEAGAPAAKDGPDGGPLECDAFDRTDLVTGSTMWERTGGDPAPKIREGALLAKAESSATNAGYVQSVTWPRGDTVRVSARVIVSSPQSWTSVYMGRAELFAVDGHPGLDAERAVLAYDANRLIVVYRRFTDGGQDAALAANVDWSKPHDIVLDVRFHPTEGFVKVAVDNRSVMNEAGLSTASLTSAGTWQLIVGAVPAGETPITSVSVDDLCVSRP